MLWILVGLACGGEALDTEMICDGLDDDQDGLVDEEVVGIRYEMPLDIGGAPELDAYFEFDAQVAVGVSTLSHSYELDDGSHGVDEKEYGTSGRLLYSRSEYTAADGESTSSETYTYEFEQGQPVYERFERMENEALVSGYEVVGELNGEGLLASQETTDLMDIDEAELLVFEYDSALRPISEKRYIGSDCAADYWLYPSEEIEKHILNRSCDTTPSSAASYTYVYERDSQGRLISFVDNDDDAVWTWTWVGDRLTRDYVRSTQELKRVYEFEDGRFVRGEAQDLREDWVVEYDSFGTPVSVELASQEQDEQVLLKMDLRDQEGSSVVEFFQILLLQEEEDDRDRRWWQLEAEMDGLGNLLGGLYQSFGPYYAVEHTWAHSCHEAQP